VPPGNWTFEEILTELTLYLAHSDDDDPKYIVKYVGRLSENIDVETLEKFNDDLSQAVYSLEQADLDVKPIVIQIFREWVSEVERFSFNRTFE
jgi:hypothetical protein